MKRRIISLYQKIRIVFFFPGLVFAGHTITIDGQFQDWDQVPLAYSDPQSSDQMSADFADVKITYDMEFLFIYFNFYGNEFLLQDWNDFHLLLDTDHNGSTGLAIDGIGAELDWTFGSRSGIQYLNGSQYELWQNDITLRVGPTITSQEFEIGISRYCGPLTMNGSQVMVEGRIIINSGDSTQDQVPDEPGGIYFSIGEDVVPDPVAIPLERRHEDDIRIISYNTWNDGILDDERKPRFKRIIQALDPDVIALQEHWDWDEIDDIIQSWFPQEEWFASWTYRDLVVLSRFPILEDANMISSERTMAVLLDTESELGKDLLVFNSHLSCCANNDDRQQQVDEFISVWRDWISGGEGPFEIDTETPFVHVGDFNFVGYRQQVETIRTGDIQNEADHGPDFPPDWDSSDIIDLFSRHTHKRMGYTWRSDGSSFNPGKLDYVFYSDATIDTGRHFTLNTLAIDEGTLLEMGLESEDTNEASDHLPRVFDISISTGLGMKNKPILPSGIFLYPNHPNPFNTMTSIQFSVPIGIPVRLDIYDLLGREVRSLIDETMQAGDHEDFWDGKNNFNEPVETGIYFFQLRVGKMRQIRKMVLLK